ncbi:hypothetical protein [Enterobacter hormaechei]|nr:hypothetical protein [Enterobacter hormaechei]
MSLIHHPGYSWIRRFFLFRYSWCICPVNFQCRTPLANVTTRRFGKILVALAVMLACCTIQFDQMAYTALNSVNVVLRH